MGYRWSFVDFDNRTTYIRKSGFWKLALLPSLQLEIYSVVQKIGSKTLPELNIWDLAPTMSQLPASVNPGPIMNRGLYVKVISMFFMLLGFGLVIRKSFNNIYCRLLICLSISSLICAMIFQIIGIVIYWRFFVLLSICVSISIAYGLQESFRCIKSKYRNYIGHVAIAVLGMAISVVWFDGVRYSIEIYESKIAEITKQRHLLNIVSNLTDQNNFKNATIISGAKSPLAAIKKDMSVTQFIPFNWIPMVGSTGRLEFDIKNLGQKRDDIIDHLSKVDAMVFDFDHPACEVRKIMKGREGYSRSIENGIEIITRNNPLIDSNPFTNIKQ